MGHARPLGLLLAVVATLSSSATSAQVFRFQAKVLAVSSGDIITVLLHDRQEEIRLNGIDCPEPHQPFGTPAKQFTSDRALGEMVTVRVVDTDRDGRWLGDVTLPDSRSLNQDLVAAGLAWWYPEHWNDQALAGLEAEARMDARGLWADANPIPPWEWRQRASEGEAPGPR